MNIGIVGLGIIGGSYAKALRKYPYKIYGIDSNLETLETALNDNIIDVGSQTADSFVNELDVIFVCLYPKDTIKFIRKYQNKFKKGAVISDVAGTKRNIADALIYEEEVYEIVLSHPIAGREKSGYEYCDEAIFQSANFIITPHKYSTEENMRLIEVLAKQMGFSTVSYIKDVEHDEILGYTSHLTHVIAMALVNSNNHNKTKPFIGDSYKELTRIAAINEKLWSELLLANKSNVIKHIDNFVNEIEDIRKALINNDIDKLEILMKKSTNKKAIIDEE